MNSKRILLVLISFLLCYNFAFAGSLVADEAGTYFNEGVKAQKGGNFQAAEISYQKTLLIAPDSKKWKKYIFNNYGAMFAQMGELQRAEEALNNALKVDPDYMPAKLNLGMINDKQRTRLESLEYWAKVFNLDSLKPKEFVVSVEETTTGK